MTVLLIIIPAKVPTTMSATTLMSMAMVSVAEHGSKRSCMLRRIRTLVYKIWVVNTRACCAIDAGVRPAHIHL